MSTYTTAAAATFILAELSTRAPYSMRVAEAARAGYRAWAMINGENAAALEFVRHGSRQVRRYIRIGYTAIANLKRAGRIAAQQGGRVRFSTAAAAVAAAPMAVATPAMIAAAAPVAAPAPGSVRVAFDAFMSAVDGDAGRWIGAFAVSESDRQVAAVRSLRAMLDSAEALLAEEGVAV